ncbi:chemotaxis protein CheW [Haliangium ochraceum]|uniref:CheW protein n=1 Tax=Haliangium ochraceum (strain DSM 14365 / JCM 11303 / SMP-2) TaxID=502025 RepID=D0LTR5_HALO1|nr:chemotaxis protein CheW [Haliangium ochraceum]ACY15759.1 CheW protein [Haliangium ochraceum DSM 14365]
MTDVLTFRVAEATFAVPLERVAEVTLRVALEPLPELGAPIAGYFVYRGRSIAAVDLRQRLDYPARPIDLADHFVIARGRARLLALIVDRVLGVRHIDLQAVEPTPANSEWMVGIVALSDGLLLIADLEAALSVEQNRSVAEALARLTPLESDALPARDAGDPA